MDDDDLAGAIVDLGPCPNLGCATVLLCCLESPEREVRVSAAASLRRTRDPAILSEMVALLGAHRWLGHSQTGNFTQAAHGETSISAVVRSAFSQTNEIHSQVLLERLQHIDHRVREAAAELLQYQSGPEVRSALIDALQNDRDAAVRARAAFGLGKLCDPSTLEVLVDALSDESSRVQSKAAHALSRLGKSAAPAAAIQLVIGSPETSLYSARLLGHAGSPEAVDALIQALRSKKGLVHLFAEQALAQMGIAVLPTLLESLFHQSDAVLMRDGIAYVLRTMPMPDRERRLMEPVIDAAEQLNAELEAPAAASAALGVLEGLTPEELRSRLRDI